MSPLELLKGRTVRVRTDVGVEVDLEVKEIKRNQHSRDLEPSTRENDWWPASVDWETYTVYFTNGYSKNYDSLESINIIK